MEQIYKQIKEYIYAHRRDMLNLWEEIVNTESGSRQKPGVDNVNKILAQEMNKCNIKTRSIVMEDAGNVLVGEWNNGSSKAPIIFLGHMDTVFKEGAAAKNPFRIDENNQAHGPGVLDMKGGLVIALYAVKALQAVNYTGHPVKFVFAGDEENLHSFSNAKQAMAQEIKGARAAFNFETGYEDDSVVVGRKGGAICKIDIKGVASHSGIAPEKGRSANKEMAYKLIEIEKLNDLSRGKLVNCGVVHGGTGENIISPECHLSIGIRFPTMSIKQEIIDQLQQITDKSTVEGTSAKLSFGTGLDCMETTPQVMELFNLYQQTAQECGYGSVHPFQVAGVSDSGIAVVEGVPTICGVGVKGSGAHSEQEYAHVDSLYERCMLAACTVYNLK